MMKKTIITKREPDGTVKTATLIFSHSFRTERDIMADISKQPRPIFNKSRNQQRFDDSQGNIQRTASNRNGNNQKPPVVSRRNSNAFEILEDNN
jgi:hypothetical protein